MTRPEVLEFVRRNSTSWMATVENGEPRVRGMDTPHVDEKGFVYCTGRMKNVARQLRANPAVELCFFSGKEGLQIRIRGRMEEISEPELLEHIVETRFTFLKPVVKAHGWETLTLFRLARGELRTWSAGKPAGVTEEVGEF